MYFTFSNFVGWKIGIRDVSITKMSIKLCGVIFHSKPVSLVSRQIHGLRASLFYVHIFYKEYFELFVVLNHIRKQIQITFEVLKSLYVFMPVDIFIMITFWEAQVSPKFKIKCKKLCLLTFSFTRCDVNSMYVMPPPPWFKSLGFASPFL